MIPFDVASTLIDLDPERVNRAIALSQTLTNPLTRWQSYLALLALEGFSQWLGDRATSIEYDRSSARLLEPSGFGSPAAINSVYANQFHLGFFVVDDIENEIEFPVSLLQNPAHFYVAACVDTETNQVSFHSFLQGNLSALNLAKNDTDTIPVWQFETNLEQLLWYLASLELSAILLPSANPVILPQRLIQPIVNAAQWVQTQIDELTWTLFSLERAPAMRTRVNASAVDFAAVLTEIERCGIRIPETAQSGYRSMTLNHHTFRLYLVTWTLEETLREWSLLVILESIQEATLPVGTQLMVQEGSTVLVQEQAREESAYLIAQVIGSWDEAFTLTLSLVDPGNNDLIDALILPAIVFQPNLG